MRAIYGFVYLIRNRVSGRVYVGQTTRPVSQRWSEHKSNALLRPKSIVHKAVKKYGPDSFDIVELGRALSPSELNDMEARAIWTHESDDREFGYNIEQGGKCNPRSAETRMKLSEAARRRAPLSAEIRARISATLKGRKLDPEVVAKRAKAQTGRKRPPTTRARMREAWVLRKARVAELVEKEQWAFQS